MDRSHLVLEYQALVNETKRKYPDVKDAAERAIVTSRNTSIDVRQDGRHSDELLAPIELGCRTKVPKIVATSIGALQRLVGVGALTQRLVPTALSMLGDAISAGLDAQLKILQVLLFIVKYCQGVHGDVLSQLLLLCFRLHDSKVGIVSSTAAATLRQAVMMVFERLNAEKVATSASEDHLAEDANGPAGLAESTVEALSPTVSDAFWIFQDLCSLLSPAEVRKHQRQQSRSGKKTQGGTVILQLRDLSKTFGLELVESILNGFSKEILLRPELLAVLRSSLCSLLAQSVQQSLDFAVTLRLIRLQYLVVRSYASRLPLETEVFLNTFIGFALGENAAGRRPSIAADATPYWLRVMSLEALLGLFQSSELTAFIWRTYDAVDGHSDLLTKTIDALNRILSERPAHLGASTEMQGLHIGTLASPSQTFSPTREETYLDKGFNVMASAATMGVNTVSAMMTGEQSEGLDASACTMKVQCIEQHDKAEPPVIPDKNLYLLAIKAFNRIVGNIASSRQISQGAISTCWTAFLATYSLLLKANISLDLFHETLDSLRSLMLTIGELDLQTPREAFFTALGRMALPASLISATQQYQEHGQKPAVTTAADALGLGASAPPRRPVMSERNVACLQVILDVVERTQDGIKDSWLRLLPVLEDANYILQPAGRRGVPNGTPEIPSSPRIQRTASYATNEPENLLASIASDRLQGVFAHTSSLSDISLRALVQAICTNSAELIKGRLGFEATTPITPRADRSLDLVRPISKGERAYRAHKSQYCVMLLDKVANTNLERFVADDELWRNTTDHLFFIASHADLSFESRVQAVQAILHMVQETLNRNEEPPAGEALTAQSRALATLSRLVKADQDSNLDAELRAISLERLNTILEFSGHTLVDAWPTIFHALQTTCVENRSRTAPSLVRTAFVALNLICSDFAVTLTDWQSCIACLSAFGAQHIDVNVSLSAIGLMWQMSDHLRNAPQGKASTDLLVSLSKLCTDARAEVRLSALQTLFRCISTLSASDGIDEIIFALLEDFDKKSSQSENAADWDETGSTILGEIGALIAAGHCLQTPGQADRVASYTSPWTAQPGTKLCTASLELEARLDSPRSTAFERISDILRSQAENGTLEQATAGPYFTQDNLGAVVGLLRKRAATDAASALDCAILAVQYRLSPTYPADVDVLSPLQQAVVHLWTTAKAEPSLRLKIANGLLRLAFERPFQFVDMTMRFGSSSKTTMKDVTFVGLHKTMLVKAQQLALGECGRLVEGSEDVIGDYVKTLMLPIELGTACPAANKYGDDPALPFSARSALIGVLDSMLSRAMGSGVTTERRSEIWQVTCRAIRALLPDVSASEKGKERAVPTSAEQDLAVVRLLQEMILPRLSSSDVPHQIIGDFARCFQQASVLWIYRERSRWDFATCAPRPTVAPADRLAGESIRLRCLDLLFAGSNGRQEDPRVRDAFGAALESRARSSLTSMLADLRIRGSMPFERIREMDMLLLLQRIEHEPRPHWMWLPPLLLELVAMRQASLPQLPFSAQDPILHVPSAVMTLTTQADTGLDSADSASQANTGEGRTLRAEGSQSVKIENDLRITLHAGELAVRILGNMTGGRPPKIE